MINVLKHTTEWKLTQKQILHQAIMQVICNATIWF